jgi:DNA-binding MarR family transcriptional regulator
MGPKAAGVGWTDRLIAALNVIAATNESATVKQIIALLYVAQKPGITQTELMNKLDFSSSGMSELVSLLTSDGLRHRPGWDVIEKRVDEDDTRSKPLHLSAHGRAVLEAVRKQLDAH